ARKGYLHRMEKRGGTPRVQATEKADPVAMGQRVVPLTHLSIDDVRRLLESTYGKDSGIEVTKPGTAAKGVIVTAPRTELDGIAALVKQAEPSDLDFLLSVESQLPEHMFSSERDIALSPEVHAEMRKSATEYLKTNKPDRKHRTKPANWFRGSRPKPKVSRTAVKLHHANAVELAKELQPLFVVGDVQIEPVKDAGIILLKGPASTLADLRESIVQMDHTAKQDTEDKIADRTKYIRRMASSRNNAFRITRPLKPHIKPLPAITITGDPQPIYENTRALQPADWGTYEPKKIDSTSNEPVKDEWADSYIESYIKKSLEEANKPRQKPVFRLESGEYIDVQTIWDTYGPASQPSSRGSSSFQSGNIRSSTKQN
ncbi:MAG: hypothetical protein MKZ92_11735, partial [Pedosphaera sp.]|nr:hypothetical protein [Pedosphaera sp.]